LEERTVQSLRDAVDTAIAQSGDAIVNRVTSHYVDAEIERRAKLIVTGVEAVRQAEADLKKVDRGDDVRYAADGTIAVQYYTKARIEEVKKGKTRVERLTAALNAVLVSHSADHYKKLDETIKKAGKGGNFDDKESEAEAA
jgi:hypothetical protein